MSVFGGTGFFFNETDALLSRNLKAADVRSNSRTKKSFIQHKLYR